jgi:hypothetical protein
MGAVAGLDIPELEGDGGAVDIRGPAGGMSRMTPELPGRSAVRAQETRFPALPSPRRFNDELVSGARPLLLSLS